LLALGRIAHDAVLLAFGERRSAFTFAHGAEHRLSGGPTLVDSYHCSRYNTNTGKLTAAMFDDVFDHIDRRLGRTSARRS
jgi:uracil-DNA glycosylase